MHKIFLHFICCQGRPTEAMAETEPLVYGGQVAKDFIPGAEILPEEAEPKEEKEKNGVNEIRIADEIKMVWVIAFENCMRYRFKETFEWKINLRNLFFVPMTISE